MDAVDGLSDSALTPGGLAARKEALSALGTAMGDLPSDERRVVELRLLQDKSLEETAEATGRSPGAVRGLVHRAKRRLRAMMQGSSRWFDKK
jgi:RNA polymerase sigma-70 factor (ECF subfamily)